MDKSRKHFAKSSVIWRSPSPGILAEAAEETWKEGEARLRTDSILGGNTKGKNRRELKYEAKS